MNLIYCPVNFGVVFRISKMVIYSQKGKSLLAEGYYIMTNRTENAKDILGTEFLFKEQITEIDYHVKQIIKGAITDDSKLIGESYYEYIQSMVQLVNDISSWESELDEREKNLEKELHASLLNAFEKFYK